MRNKNQLRKYKEAKNRAFELIKTWARECISPNICAATFEKEYIGLAQIVLSLFKENFTVHELGEKILMELYKNYDYHRDGVSYRASMLIHIEEVAHYMMDKDFVEVFLAMDNHCKHEPHGWFQDYPD